MDNRKLIFVHICNLNGVEYFSFSIIITTFINRI